MTGLDAIIEAILEEARKKAQEIAERAEEQAGNIRREGEEEAERLRSSMASAAEADAEALLSRARSAASLAARRTRLEARQTRISDFVDQALERLSSLPDEKKIELYARFLEAGRGGETVVFSDRDRTSGVAQASLARAEEVRKDRGLPRADWTVDSTPGAFSGGLVLRRGRIEENLTFELIVQQARVELETYAASLLGG